jgi:lipopolysaccharide transport system ATP-binding protein
MEFQKKCLGKMEEVSKRHGRTILFVSHNMTYISSLCTKGLLLNNGKIAAKGDINEVISVYVSDIANRTARQSWKKNEQPGNDIVKLHTVGLVNSSMNTIENFKVTEDIGIEMIYEVMKDNEVLWLGHNIHNEQGINIFDTHSVGTDYYRQPHNKGMYSSIVWIPHDLLNPGVFFISSAIFNHLKNVIHLHELDILMFAVHEVFDQETARGLSGGDFPGVVRPLLKWQIKKI